MQRQGSHVNNRGGLGQAYLPDLINRVVSGEWQPDLLGLRDHKRRTNTYTQPVLRPIAEAGLCPRGWLGPRPVAEAHLHFTDHKHGGQVGVVAEFSYEGIDVQVRLPQLGACAVPADHLLTG